MAIVAKIKPNAATVIIMIRRLRFFAAMPTRGTSIEERFDAKPAGRTIVSSFDLRWGITVGLKLSKCPTELCHCICRADEWHDSNEGEEYKTNRFHEKIVSRFLLKILSADISKTRGLNSGASSTIPVKYHWAIMKVDDWEPVAVAGN
jgi:hypothetical protein